MNFQRANKRDEIALTKLSMAWRLARELSFGVCIRQNLPPPSNYWPHRNESFIQGLQTRYKTSHPRTLNHTAIGVSFWGVPDLKTKSIPIEELTKPDSSSSLWSKIKAISSSGQTIGSCHARTHTHAIYIYACVCIHTYILICIPIYTNTIQSYM